MTDMPSSPPRNADKGNIPDATIIGNGNKLEKYYISPKRKRANCPVGSKKVNTMSELITAQSCLEEIPFYDDPLDRDDYFEGSEVKKYTATFNSENRGELKPDALCTSRTLFRKIRYTLPLCSLYSGFDNMDFSIDSYILETPSFN